MAGLFPVSQSQRLGQSSAPSFLCLESGCSSKAQFTGNLEEHTRKEKLVIHSRTPQLQVLPGTFYLYQAAESLKEPQELFHIKAKCLSSPESQSEHGQGCDFPRY